MAPNGQGKSTATHLYGALHDAIRTSGSSSQFIRDRETRKRPGIRRIGTPVPADVMLHANRSLGDPHKAEDAVQSTFLEAFTKLHQLQNPLAFPGWLRRIAQTQCHRQIRKRNHPTLPLDEARYVASGDPSPLDVTERNDRDARLDQAIEKLPESERAPTRMFYFDQLSHAEIADRLQIQPKTVKSRLHSARGRLRTTLSRRNSILERMASIGAPSLEVSTVAAGPSQVVQLPTRTSAVSMAA